MITVINKNATKCVTKCHKCLKPLIFDGCEVKEINQGAWEEYIVKCPICGTHIPVCYINGSWR